MSERQATVLVDMDGVMADFDTAALANVPQDKIVPRQNFYVAEDYPAEMRECIESMYNAGGFFERLEPMPGLHEGWQALIDAGFTPRVCSAPLSSNKTSTEGKIEWLKRFMVPEFGAGVVENAIIDKQKWKYSGVALIDDRPSVPRGPEGRDEADWQHVLFGWEHLKKVPLATAAFRLLNWHGTDGLVGTLDAIVREREQNKG